MTCFKRRGSATTTSTSGSITTSSDSPCRLARSRTIATPCSSASRREASASSSFICPASTLERSRISFSNSSRWRPESRMSSRYSACLSLSSPNSRSSRTSENPITALSGVLNSWDMLARNSDL